MLNGSQDPRRQQNMSSLLRLHSPSQCGRDHHQFFDTPSYIGRWNDLLALFSAANEVILLLVSQSSLRFMRLAYL